MAYTAGETIRDFITHRTDLDVAITGASFTVEVARKPDGSSFTPTISDLGSGVYEISFATARGEEGQWYLLLTDNGQSPPRSYDGVWDVDAAPSQTDPGVAGVGSTRTSIRRRIGRLFGDMVLCTATAGGSEGTFVDYINLFRANGELTGRHLYLSGGTADNLGHYARVTYNDQTLQEISFAPSAPAATQIADVAEVWNTRNLGLTVPEVHDAINFCISDISDLFVAAASESLGTFAYDTPVLSLPTEWRFFSGLDYQDTLGVWHPIEKGDWRLDKAARTVEVRNRPRWRANGMSVRARGYTVPALLETDDDTTGVNAEWLAYQTAANLAMSISPRALDGGVNLQARAQFWQQKADERRYLNGIRPSGVFVRLG